MRKNGAESIVLYYKAIPNMVRLLEQERAELEDEYSSLRATPYDGTPHGSTPGKPTEDRAMRLAENGNRDRLREIAVRIEVLRGDAATIRAALDSMSGKYKSLIHTRLLYGYSWGKLSVRMGVPDSTVRYWYRMALERLAEVLDEAPMADELEGRASRARSL
jgi:DNA-directed RNA polymerase specialized sigma24 family protein